jgi:hypothetical protein
VDVLVGVDPANDNLGLLSHAGSGPFSR